MYSIFFLNRLLADAVVNFQTNQEEITLLITPEKISLKNYVDDEPGMYSKTDLNRTLFGLMNLFSLDRGLVYTGSNYRHCDCKVCLV